MKFQLSNKGKINIIGNHIGYIFLGIISIFSVKVFSQNQSLDKDIAYYLPSNISYDKAIPKPSEVIGHPVGKWHITHDKLVHYAKTIAAASDRVTIKEIGKTYEDRPLLVLTITHPSNQQRIEEIRLQHLQLTDAKKSSKLNIKKMPAVIYMGYSIHGNEPSGSNASLIAMYYLAAAQGKSVEELLRNTVILLDPSFNPDGLNRFATWANMHRGTKTLVSDRQNVEQNELWPTGRTNHYWFDMNRDWLYSQMVESKARLKEFHRWKPNLLTDHHEMGTDDTFFFQPGEPDRVHPITPIKNQDLTKLLAKFHANALDEIRSLYFSQEQYDDFYYGKGSTLPDVSGSVGILFEQGSSRSHSAESVNGLLTFPFTIKNQFTATLSSLEGVLRLREDFLIYQRDFFKNSAAQAAKDPVKAWVFGGKDPASDYDMIRALKTQDVKIYYLSRNLKKSGKAFDKKHSYIIPMNQPQYRFIKAVFETRTRFADSLFYDVSTFTMPLSYNIPYAAIKSATKKYLGKEVKIEDIPQGKRIGVDSDYAYVIPYNSYHTPIALSRLLKSGVIVKVATQPFSTGEYDFLQGDLMIPLGIQPNKEEEIEKQLTDIASQLKVTVYGLNSGYTQGKNLGSEAFQRIYPVRLAMVIGKGVNPYDAGEMWFLTDRSLQIPLTMIKKPQLKDADLDKYEVLILPDGKYGDFEHDKIKSWVARGGTLIAFKRAVKSLIDKKTIELIIKTPEKPKPTQLAYDAVSRLKGAQVTGGAIVNTQIDLTHPLCYGIRTPYLPFFKKGNLVLAPSENPAANPIMMTASPLLSGYLSKENLKNCAGGSMLQVAQLGKGRVVCFTDNPNFRIFWRDTQKVFFNSLFFSQILAKYADAQQPLFR